MPFDMPARVVKSRADKQVRLLQARTNTGYVRKANTKFVNDDLASLKGIVAAVAVSGALWAGLGSAVWALLH